MGSTWKKVTGEARGNPIERLRMPRELHDQVTATIRRLTRTSSLGDLPTMSDFLRRAVVNELRKIERSRTWRRRKKELALHRRAS